MNLNNKYFFLNRECFYENGISKGIIYNLYTDDIYTIESPYSKIISLCEHGRLTIDEAMIELKINHDKSKQLEIHNLINELVKLDLGEVYDNKIFIEKTKPASTKEQNLIQDNPPLIKHLWLKINNICNLKCIYCYNENVTIEKCGCHVIPQNSNNNLKINQWKEILNDAALFNCQTVHFIGGEPLLMLNELLTLIKYTKLLKIPSIFLTTNGQLLTSDIISKLIQEGVHFIIPFFSWRQEIYDLITGIQGSYNKVLKTIKEIKNQHGSLSVEILITKNNQDDFFNTKEFLHDLKIENINFQILKSNQSELFPDKFKDKVYRTDEIFSNISKNQFFLNKEGHPCWDGKVAVLLNGNVLPCIMANNFCLGNILKKPFRQIIRTSGLIGKYWDLTKDKIDVCRDCEFRYACSDCRIIESLDGSLTGKNKFCTYNPSTGIWESDNNQIKI